MLGRSRASPMASGGISQDPVSGIGEHSVSCRRCQQRRRSRQESRWSATRDWALKIGDPTVSGIAFGHIVNAPRCKRVKERVKVPARWVTVRRHHKLVKVKRRAHLKLKKVTKCHPRTAIKRVAIRVRVRRHGKKVWVTRHKRKRSCCCPHIKNSAHLRVAHGKPATVSGWLGTYSGVALAGQHVTVLAAADNGLGRFAPVAAATTAAERHLERPAARGAGKADRGRVQRRPHHRTFGIGSGQADRPRQGEAAARDAPPGCLGRNRPPGRPARRRLPAARRSARTATDRPRLCSHDLWRARTRRRQWPLHDDLHVRARTRERAPLLLVSDGVAAHRQLSLRSRDEPPGDRCGRRAPLSPAPPPQDEAPSFSVAVVSS